MAKGSVWHVESAVWMLATLNPYNERERGSQGESIDMSGEEDRTVKGEALSGRSEETFAQLLVQKAREEHMEQGGKVYLEGGGTGDTREGNKGTEKPSGTPA